MQVLTAASTVSLKNCWRGVYSVILGAGPAHALHFATFEYCRSKFATGKHDLMASGAAGACATFAHDALMTPFDGKEKVKMWEGEKKRVSNGG